MKLKFNDTWAHPQHNARIGDVTDVPDHLAEQLVAGRHAEPYVPPALAEGAPPDAATEARINQLEAQLSAVISMIRAQGVDPRAAFQKAVNEEPGVRVGPLAPEGVLVPEGEVVGPFSNLPH